MTRYRVDMGCKEIAECSSFEAAMAVVRLAALNGKQAFATPLGWAAYYDKLQEKDNDRQS